MFRCIYCSKNHLDSERATEHIVPQSLGGRFLNIWPFITEDVCKRCNSTIGLFVDGLFYHSWMPYNFTTLSYDKFIDLDKGTIVPLGYIGVVNELADEVERCDYWIGLAGETIFHLHSNYDDKFANQIGGNPIRENTNPGVVYYIPSCINPDWYKCCFMSLVDQFNVQRRISLNCIIEGSNETIFHNPTEEEKNRWLHFKRYVDDVNARDESIKATFSTEIGFEHRLLAKLAIGIGYCLLGEKYLTTKSYLDLLSMLWSKNLDERNDLDIHGSDYSMNIQLTDTLRLMFREDCISIVLARDHNTYSLLISFWRQINLSIMILDPEKDNEHFKSNLENFWIYYLCKPRKSAYGPFTLCDIINHINRRSLIEDLDTLDQCRSNPYPLPKRILP